MCVSALAKKIEESTERGRIFRKKVDCEEEGEEEKRTAINILSGGWREAKKRMFSFCVRSNGGLLLTGCG